jgi:hypothetical protein
MKKNKIIEAPTELAATNHDCQNWRKKTSYQASTELAATNPDFENWKKHQLPSFNWACSHERWLRKLKKTPATKIQLSLQPPTKILKIEIKIRYQAPTELTATNQDFENWKNNQIPSFNWACSHEPRRGKLEKYTANKLQPSLQTPAQTLKIWKIYSKQASTELAATNQVCNNWKKNMLPSFNWACSHEPRHRKLKKTPATKLQLSLQPRTMTSKIEKNTSYHASAELTATNHDFETWKINQIPSFKPSCSQQPSL